MTQKLKTHFEEVPLEVAQKIAEQQIAIEPSQAPGSEQFRGPAKKRPSKVLKPKVVAGKREDA